MNSRSTVVLLILALGLFAYIALVERPSPNSTSGADTAEKLLPDFEPSKVTSIEILRSNSVVHVERTNGLWRLAELKYPAQSSMIENWLAIVGASHRRAHISAKELLEEPNGAAAFGTDNPLATVTIEHEGKKVKFWVGHKTPVGDKLYVRFIGADGLEVTESALADFLPPSATEWRDPTFAPLSGGKFNRASVRVGTREFAREFEVQRDPTNRLWRLTKPRSARADTALLDQLFQLLQATRVSQFVSDIPGNDLEPFGLQPADMTITLAESTNNLLTIEFGKNTTNDPGTVFARRSTYPGIVTVPKELRDRLRAPYTEFLDRRLIEIAPDDVSRIEVRAAETFALQKQTNGSWRVVEPTNFPADPGLVAYFFKRLNGLQITDVAKEVVTDMDFPTYGLAPPTRQYALKRFESETNTNRLVTEIDFGSAQRERVFARRTDENSVYLVKLDDALELPQHAFELHDRRIWNFSTNQVASMTVTVQTNTWKLLRTGDGRWNLAPGSQGIINPFELDEAVYRLGQLWSRAWVNPGDENFRFDETGHKLTVQINNGDKPQTFSVRFGKPSPTGGPFALTDLESGPTVFEFPIEVFHYYENVVRSLGAGVGP